MLHRPLLLLSAVVLSSVAARAQNFAFHVVQPQSTVDITSNFELALPGTVIGDFDAVNNPAGTRTLPGLFGGSGNQPVTMNITLQTALAFQGQPLGTFDAQVDLNNLGLSVDNFSLDALGGQNGQADLTLELLYQTFRTFQPTSLYIGGIALPLPLGQGTVSGLSFVQNGAGVGVLIPDPSIPGQYTATLLVPTDVTFTLDLLGTVTPVGPLPLALPLVGTLTVNGGAAQFALVIKQSTSQTIPDPFPGQTIDNFALAVPTILPPGGTANLLFSAIFGDILFDLSSSIHIVADGAAVCAVAHICPPTPNSVGSGATIDVLGSPSASANNMSIRTSNLPAHKMSTVLFGSQPKATPFGGGTLCVGGSVYRLFPVQSDAFGNSVFPVDFTNPSPKYQALVPGSVWYFQTLYRDPSFIGPPGNTSEALSVQICP